MDDQISAILKNISKKEIRTMEEVQKRTRDAVHDIFEEFMCYKNNEVNKKLALMELEDYEVIDLGNIHKHDDIIYFKTRYFFNIQLVKGKAINVLSGDRLQVKMVKYSTFVVNTTFESLPRKIKLKFRC